MTHIPFHDFGGAGETIHLSHANAYPPGCYQQLVAPFLEQYRVIGIKHRPLWPDSRPGEVKNWHILADDLIDFLEQQQLKNVIGIGHSMGAVATLLASIKRPDLFSKLVLIDPVLLPPFMIRSAQLLPFSWRHKLIPIMAGALKRKDSWDSKEALFASYRPKRVFKQFSDEALWDFIEHGTEPTADGRITLIYSKEWEARIYGTPTYIWHKLNQVTTPTLAIRAEHSQTPNATMWQKWQAQQPQATFVQIPSTSHLVPMEKPHELAPLILDYIQ